MSAPRSSPSSCSPPAATISPAPARRPEGARTIRIERFTNARARPARRPPATAPSRRVPPAGALRVVTEGDADLVLSGTIRRFTSVPVAFSATDEAVQYQGIMQWSLRLTERETATSSSRTSPPWSAEMSRASSSSGRSAPPAERRSPICTWQVGEVACVIVRAKARAADDDPLTAPKSCDSWRSLFSKRSGRSRAR